MRLKGGTAVVDAPPEPSGKLRRALLSVSDKTGLADFARGLADLGVEIIASGGTAKALSAAGVPVRPVESLTGFPEILSGRVKTLHPAVHGGLLMRREDPEHRAQAEELGIGPIDLVAVDLYPFSEVLAREGGKLTPDAVENIDIGGSALLRAASKNFASVAAVSSPEDYASVLSELRRSEGRLSLETRRRLALAAFKRTAAYDAQIAAAFAGEPAKPAAEFPAALGLTLHKLQDLRYGENPHQKAALYGPKPQAGFVQLHGKELSYNNLLDAAGVWEAAWDFKDPACVIFKHVSPCGAAVGKTVSEAFTAAWACDPLSAFGSVIGFNRPVTAAVAADLEKRFVEALVAPAFEPEALAILRKKQNLRLVVRPTGPEKAWQLRSVGPEVLVSESDRELFGSEWNVVSKRKPSADEESALRFAWTCAKHARSNAAVLAGPRAAVGIGGGQTSRVDAVFMAGVKYKEYLRAGNAAPPVLVLASDAFFPFRDGVDAAASLGARAIAAPKGSIRDAEVVKAAD
ncbi:MAG: bifunctional phosphoribosylaminoimidazolecarboxamide formyltransferase/IMP cyclohydrolase, partial [Elusimicrobia bacterium]|nr:bifunctional phosphoribosylaminoimidazolecarboxamide formyltransferase/IMP cyclohydrolase [Elusimicrobiota bacterium]